MVRPRLAVTFAGLWLASGVSLWPAPTLEFFVCPSSTNALEKMSDRSQAACPEPPPATDPAPFFPSKPWTVFTAPTSVLSIELNADEPGPDSVRSLFPYPQGIPMTFFDPLDLHQALIPDVTNGPAVMDTPLVSSDKYHEADAAPRRRSSRANDPEGSSPDWAIFNLLLALILLVVLLARSQG